MKEGCILALKDFIDPNGMNWRGVYSRYYLTVDYPTVHLEQIYTCITGTANLQIKNPILDVTVAHQDEDSITLVWYVKT